MNFAEVIFWELLFAALLVILLLRWGVMKRAAAALETFDKVALFILGLFLLGCVSRITLVIFLVVAIGTYVGLDWVLRHDERRRRRYLFVVIPLQLLPLFFYKYANFVANQVLGAQFDILRDLIIPVGISFYTFQKIAFVLDTLHFHKPLPRFLDYLNFAGFFPQIVAGPIERRENLLPQMEAFRFRWTPQDIDAGISWIVLGLFFKCGMADNFALYFDRTSQDNAYLIWLNNLIFGLRIYYDFAGYSLVALGVGRCLGVRLTLNFASPYCATSITEFWHRWHITLSQWFRDYLYIPLGGSRVKWWMFNIMLVFVVSGIWHGAGWNFVLWGAMHGGFLVLNRLLKPHLKLPGFVAWALTMLASFAAWLSFYELQPPVLVTKFQTLLTPTAYNARALHEALQRWVGPDQLVLSAMLALSALVFVLEWRSLATTNEPYALLRRPKVLVVLILLTLLLAPGKNNDFIYFAF
jgi:D-alanyl-lipoteichoic acid acyltransferase DltB (MBOAT superfamily)